MLSILNVEQVTLLLKTDYPICLDFHFAEGKCKYYIAPRVNAKDDSEEIS